MVGILSVNFHAMCLLHSTVVAISLIGEHVETTPTPIVSDGCFPCKF